MASPPYAMQPAAASRGKVALQQRPPSRDLATGSPHQARLAAFIADDVGGAPPPPLLADIEADIEAQRIGIGGSDSGGTCDSGSLLVARLQVLPPAGTPAAQLIRSVNIQRRVTTILDTRETGAQCSEWDVVAPHISAVKHLSTSFRSHRTGG